MEKYDKLELLALGAIREMQIAKRAQGIEPSYVTKVELDNMFSIALLDALRNLYRNGLVEHHKTINGISMFGIAD